MHVRLFNVGSGAGLNLRADGYRYRFADSGADRLPVAINDPWHGYDMAPSDVRAPMARRPRVALDHTAVSADERDAVCQRSEALGQLTDPRFPFAHLIMEPEPDGTGSGLRSPARAAGQAARRPWANAIRAARPCARPPGTSPPESAAATTGSAVDQGDDVAALRLPWRITPPITGSSVPNATNSDLRAQPE